MVEYPGLKIQDLEFKQCPYYENTEYAELKDGRVLRFKDSGMVFLQSEKCLLAAGPCEDNLNQVIDFITSQYVSYLRNREWLLCNCNSVEVLGAGIGIAGKPGSGRTSVVMDMLCHEEARFLSDGRMLIREDGVLLARGVPLRPSVTSKTIKSNDHLNSMLANSYDLDQDSVRYDIDIRSIYGLGKIIPETALRYLIVLNWEDGSSAKTKITECNLSSRKDLHDCLILNPGPFTSHFPVESSEVMLSHFDQITVFEVTGAMDTAKVREFFTGLAAEV
jgi:HprK-related kinase B